MKAVIYEKYGSPEVLELREIEKPSPKNNEVLIKVHATTVTAGDWRLRKAEPFLARIFNGLFKPTRVKILGFEVAGVVEEVGKDVKAYKKGDSIFASCGFKFGGYAEYKCLPVNDLVAIKPINMSFGEAAAVPIGGLTALRFLRKAGLKSGDNILIYGASGSVGTYAVQIARSFGAVVTAVCSATNVEMVRSLGAEQVIDYTAGDFTKTETRFNVVFDAVGKASASACKKLLKPGGKYVSVSGTAKSAPGDLKALKELIESGKLKAVIDRTYTLDQIREAHQYAESFRKKGNIVIKIADNQ
ncbi:MAG: NAD(P)-dependent alcohol dehydrogenase [Bacteroidales bacterium]|nr:NAD(P)-dependent alcohol dehydrogenase [Bacteroidales bacterium]